MEISAAVLRGKGENFTIETLELDDPQPDEILVRIAGAGVCHTDITIQNSPVVLPCVLGHEGSGVVEKVGSRIRKVKPGDHVVMTFVSCGRCRNCQQGLPSYCVKSFAPTFMGVRADGTTTMKKGGEKIHGSFFGQSSFATFALGMERNVIKVSSDVPVELLGPLGCGIQTGAGSVINSLKAQLGSSIAIFGMGSVGLSAVMAAKIVGCSPIIGVDINQSRLELARELGATHIINASEQDPVQTITGLTKGGADYTLEMVGNPDVLKQAFQSTRVKGVCGVVGGAPGGTQVSLDMNSILFGRTLSGFVEGDSIPDLFIPQMIDLYKSGRFPIDRLVTYYDLDQINQAVEDVKNGTTIKPVLRMD